MKLTSAFYRIARLLRDANAISRGPSAVGARMMRRALLKMAARPINKLTRLPRRRRF